MRGAFVVSFVYVFKLCKKNKNKNKTKQKKKTKQKNQVDCKMSTKNMNNYK